MDAYAKQDQQQVNAGEEANKVMEKTETELNNKVWWIQELREIFISFIECQCEKCEQYAGNVEYLEQQLSDAHITQENLKQKLSKTKTTLATTIERESRIR